MSTIIASYTFNFTRNTFFTRIILGSVDTQVHGCKGAMDAWSIAEVLLSFIDVVLHVVCLYLMRTHRSGCSDQSQQRVLLARRNYFLATILVCELLFSTRHLTRLLISYFSSTAENLIRYIMFTVNIPYCGSIIFLTLERFLQVYLNIRYNNCFFNRNKHRICFVLWSLMVVTAICVSLVVRVKAELTPYIVQINVNFLAVIHCIILLTFFGVYIYLYTVVFIQRRKIIKQTNQDFYHHRYHDSAKYTPKLFAPFLIVSCFILFLTLPAFLYMYAVKSKQTEWVYTLNRIGSIFGALFYVYFFHPSVSRALTSSCCCSSLNRKKTLVRIPSAVIVRNEQNAVCEVMTF